MLRSASHLKGYVLLAVDGEIGRSKDLLFDDDFWTVRYLVADTAKWLPGRRVLISPIALGEPDWTTQRFPVRLTKSQIKEAPDLDEDAPVSRRYEMRYFRHFNWPFYWGGPNAWAALGYAQPLYSEKATEPEPEALDATGDRHLRSMSEILHYKIGNGSEELGYVDDLIVEDGSWTIRYLVLNTHRWLPGRKVLISPTWIEQVSWKDQKVTLWLSREEVKASPRYEPSTPVNRNYEELLYDFYGRPAYWNEGVPARAADR